MQYSIFNIQYAPLVRWQSGYAVDCKSPLCEFESHLNLPNLACITYNLSKALTLKPKALNLYRP